MAAEPRRSRPFIPGYGIPESEEGLLPWTWARERLEEALVYWIASTRPDGRPHAIPLWGAWVGDRFYFEGGTRTRHARNIAANPAVVVHLERGDDVVIVEGAAERLSPPGQAMEARLLEGYAKYRASHGYKVDPKNWRTGGLWEVRPQVALAWSAYPRDATRWHFARPGG